MMDYSNIFRLVNLAVGGLLIVGAVANFIHTGFQEIIIGVYLVLFGAAAIVLEYQIPALLARWAPFLFSFLGRGAFYVFAGSIGLHKPAMGIVVCTIVGLIGVGYIALEYIPSIEPPQNMREASGEWGAEQI